MNTIIMNLKKFMEEILTAINERKKMTDKKAEKWNKNNKWFGKNKSLTLLAIYFHENLVDINVNPATDKYYKIINLFMEPFVTGKVKLKSRPKQRQIGELTPTQIEIARKLEVPLLEYSNQLNRVEWS